MRLLLDACINFRLARILSDAGHDVVHAAGLNQGIADLDLIALAVEDSRIIVTHDKDFSRIAFSSMAEYGGILRIEPAGVEEMYSLCKQAFSLYETELLGGYVLIIEGNRIRRISPYLPDNGNA